MMKNRQLAARVTVLVCSLLSGPALADIPIAVAGPMKGQFAAFGAQMLAGAEQAVADINAAGGVNGEPLVLEVADDSCGAETATAVANQMIGKGVKFVAGHFCFSGSIAASEVYSGAGIVQISPATTLPGYTDQRPGAGIFRLAPRDDQQGRLAGRLLAEEFGDARVAILHDKTAYGKSLADAVKIEMNRLGKSESMSYGFDSGGQDYSGLVSRLGLEDVGVVYLGGYHPEAGLIRLEMNRQGLEAVMVSGDALMTEEFWSVAGPAGNGTLVSYPQDPRDILSARDLVSVLEEAGNPAERYALTTYAAIQAWAQAAEAAGGTSEEAVAAALREGTFQTVIGAVSFDQNGDSNVPGYVWYEWRDGEVLRK
ncbi:branched-chain amino acid ABC transporter substrate-binding protein [Roseibium marinum]|uniref:Branched-chain amino acid transport system substrate-binding protein n=1 Tax=Roseibium marinum TaxID=281252 RepID=A0A2S3UVI0_9HYPH|nr:branched-chain amino acid ABC transporter substrate-binding protein [Roseibium marinum]POF31696.1 branched-chain amino acid transport system substrate-binding protein [Roseibium marinum]